MRYLNARFLSLVQGIYFLATGIWPLISESTFLAVTGPKHDVWLVKTVGLLVATIGLALLAARRENNFSFAVRWLAFGSALCLAGVDIFYSLTGRISAIYLVDAVVELILAGAWAACFRDQEA